MRDAFKTDLINELGADNFEKIDFILDILDNEPFYDFEKDGITVSCYHEKIHQLQENVCVSISCNDFEIELLYENGINNGTQLIDYRINSEFSFTRDKREYEVITGIELDIKSMEIWSFNSGKKYSLEKAEILLSNHRNEILKLYKEQNYDNYVTGGGTNKTDSYYEKKISELHDSGIFWKFITRTEETVANFK